MISARIERASISPHYSKPLVTFVARYPKFIHGEFMTHRRFSRNASSSRAIPVGKLIAEVRDDATRAGPVWWGAEQKGMASGDELIEPWASYARGAWREAAFNAARIAENMVSLRIHKSIVNRILEPFSHINVVCTATEYDNFFGLRLDRAAQPEMRTLAEAMWREYNECRPTRLEPGQWHLPFVDRETIDTYYAHFGTLSHDETEQVYGTWPQINLPFRHENNLIKISVARCARVSYQSLADPAKRSSITEDLALYDKLVGAQPMHASPAEHQATPDILLEPGGYNIEIGQVNEDMKGNRMSSPIKLEIWQNHWAHGDEHGNLVGWRQYRKMLPGEACAPLPEEHR